ncbi:MAG: DUF3857 domain-containing protein [Candidatus Aminicenantales bacterium]
MSAERSLTSAASFVALAIGAFLALPAPAAAQTTWPPILMDDAAMKDCPQQPGAPAVILYREEITDVESRTTTVFKRLKILTAAGRDLSNIEIPFITGYTKVTGIEARVVPPQGPDREFSGQVFEKTVIRYRKLRMAVKTFALPDVDVGSIIDYRYKLEYGKSNRSAKALNEIMTGLMSYGDRPEEGGVTEAKDWRALPVESWQIQEDLFTKKAKFAFTNKQSLINLILSGGWRLAWASVGMKEGSPRIGWGSAELEMSNIPAFSAEEYTIPEEMLRMSVNLFYINGAIMDGQDFWKLESTDWQKGVEKFIGKPGKLAAAVREIIGDATEPMEQLKRIYTKVQGFRNLSYEKDLTPAQMKEQKIKDNRKVDDVLERGFGLRSDVTRTFVALARAAGFTAEAVRVTARDNKLFRKDYLSFYDQLDSEVALVAVGDRTMVFDPATPFCPFGLIHWSRTNSTGLRFSDKPPAFFTTPVSPPGMALTQREIAFGLDLQGNLTGTVKTTYTGQEALVRRLEHLHDDDTVRKAALEKELTDVLPMGASATLTKVENFDNNDPALIANYDVSIPGIATVAGEKMLLPVSPLVGSGQYPFRTTARKYPVYFPYPFRDFDDIVITLPEGLTAEVRPAPRKDQNDFSAYSLVCSDEGPGKIHVQRDFVIKKSFFPVEQYGAVKALFDSVRASDEAQVIFTTKK